MLEAAAHRSDGRWRLTGIWTLRGIKSVHGSTTSRTSALQCHKSIVPPAGGFSGLSKHFKQLFSSSDGSLINYYGCNQVPVTAAVLSCTKRTVPHFHCVCSVLQIILSHSAAAGVKYKVFTFRVWIIFTLLTFWQFCCSYCNEKIIFYSLFIKHLNTTSQIWSLFSDKLFNCTYV